MVSGADAVLWFGDDEGDGHPAWLAEVLGIPLRVAGPGVPVRPRG